MRSTFYLAVVALKKKYWLKGKEMWRFYILMLPLRTVITSGNYIIATKDSNLSLLLGH